MSEPKPKTKRRPAADRAPRAPRPTAEVDPVLTYRRTVGAMLALIEHDPSLIAEAITFWTAGGEAAVGLDAHRSILAMSPNASAFADAVVDVDAATDERSCVTDAYGREDWDAAMPVVAWYAAYTDALSLCASLRARGAL